MFEFGRELKRILGANVPKDEFDPGVLELCDLATLATRARACDVEAGRVSAKEPFAILIEASAAWREHARRSGDATALRKAASAAALAAKSANGEAQSCRAMLEQGLSSLTGADLFGDTSLLEAASSLLKLAAAGSGDAVFEARLEAAFARLASREALGANDYDRALQAAALFDSAVHKLDALAEQRSSSIARAEAAQGRIERADLLAGFGLRRKEPRLLEQAGADLATLLERLDAEHEPLTWLKAAEVLGSALVCVGEIQGRAEVIAQGVALLVQASERIGREHSPLDWARARHALAIGLQSLGETCDNDPAFSRAEVAFDDAARAVADAPVAIRSTVANNRAACLARAAERRGDLDALGRAEAAFRTELLAQEPANDPVCWAVLQVNLARIYEARGELQGAFREREAAVYALEEALEVFCEHGLKAMAEAAQAALGRVRKAA